MALPLDGYVRVSRVGGRDQTDGFISPDVQERAIREWSARGGVEIVVQPHELNVSGGTMNRPIFNSILERIRAGQSGGLVVYKLDRFARTLLGALNTLEELGRHDATFASVTEPALDYTTPSGRAFVQQLFVFAEFTRSTLKESWAVAQRHAIDRGIHISPNGYLGYDLGSDRRLVPNAQSPIVVEVFRRRADGETWGRLADWLGAVAPRPDGTVWTPLAVQRLTAKRVYRGEASRYVVQDIDDRGPIINPDAHPALVTEELWRGAQMTPRVAKSGVDGKPLPLLSGLVRCAGCRYSKLGAEWHEWLDTYLQAVRESEAELGRVEQLAGASHEGFTGELYRSLTVDERREVLGGFLDTIMVRPSRGRGRNVDPVDRRVRVLWRGQGPTDLPRRRVVNEIRSFSFEQDVEAGISSAQDRA
jgi:site-specific DNA recombinase